MATGSSNSRVESAAAFALLRQPALDFLSATGWRNARCEPLAGDASSRRYFRLTQGRHTVVLMDASANRDSMSPFVQLSQHLRRLGFSAPEIFECNPQLGLMLIEDFGDASFWRLLAEGGLEDELYTLATDVLAALHRQPDAAPANLRAYGPEKMLADMELFPEWVTPQIGEKALDEFRAAWLAVLPLAHQVPQTLLLRDYHVANLMWLPRRKGVRRAGLLDFQDAYRGPITYDLMSLLEDARRDVPDELRRKMKRRYLEQFPNLDAQAFDASLAILAAVRHTRVLAIFERLYRRDNKPDYKRLHSPRVQRLLQRALQHPLLKGVKAWMERYAG